VDPTALSLAARGLRGYLAPGLGVEEGQILIGHPSASIKDAEGDVGKQYLNLFFYRVEHGAYPAHGRSDEPFYVRIHCLITALGSKAPNGDNGATISAGENDLRLIGGVMALLHENPIMGLDDKDGREVASLQIVLVPLGLDDLNHIWSTQGDTPYRLSVAYELALAPVPLTRPADRSPRVGSIATAVLANTSHAASRPADLYGEPDPSRVQRTEVDTSRPDWAPHIAFLSEANRLEEALALQTGALPASLGILAAGSPGETVTLAWETWDRASGWAPHAVEAPQRIALETAILDPDVPDSSLATEVTLPTSGPGQALLYAVREWTRPDGSVVALRSNPLLVSVYAEDGS